MTRLEAIELAKKFGNDKPWYESDISLLEALGLIKFDEQAFDTRDLVFSNSRPCAYQAIAQLEVMGYEIKLKPNA